MRFFVCTKSSIYMHMLCYVLPSPDAVYTWMSVIPHRYVIPGPPSILPSFDGPHHSSLYPPRASIIPPSSHPFFNLAIHTAPKLPILKCKMQNAKQKKETENKLPH
ncbi:hypothetical protein B0T21DRAFT_13007 [Apiosordaria backusii]|uniref:Uncharacterized protein n=1 Tax=Apiosordaria backusii TaxID=314023 RepID=A0AA40EYZ4_9PEZI|nr:hypothetical protein B0T21DRAFT_13007 [Apiosordaria backusii]